LEHVGVFAGDNNLGEEVIWSLLDIKDALSEIRGATAVNPTNRAACPEAQIQTAGQKGVTG